MHSVAPLPDAKFPGGQGRQAEMERAPDSDRNVPEGQGTQSRSSKNVPLSHTAGARRKRIKESSQSFSKGQSTRLLP